jgi:hypothetical protein
MSEFSSLLSPDAISDEKFKAASSPPIPAPSNRSKSPRSGRLLRGQEEGSWPSSNGTKTSHVARPGSVPRQNSPVDAAVAVGVGELQLPLPCGLGAIAFSSSRSPIARDGHRVRIRTEKDADRARDVVDRIGALIKKTPPGKEVVDLNAAILEVTA